MSIAVAITLCFLTPFIVGAANLNLDSSAVPLEMFVSLIGVVLLTPVFQPEQNEEIEDMIFSKYYGSTRIQIVRIIYSIVIISILITLFSSYMKTQGCEITLALTLGAIADSIFLGSIGMATSSLTRNTIVGYMPPLLYYALNIGMGPRLGNFYLFSMTSGNYSAKIWLLSSGIFMIAMSIIIQSIRKKTL